MNSTIIYILLYVLAFLAGAITIGVDVLYGPDYGLIPLLLGTIGCAFINNWQSKEIIKEYVLNNPPKYKGRNKK